MSELSLGQQHIQDMQDNGATDTTIAAMKAQKSQVFTDNGYTQKEIDDYWGDTPKEPAPVTGQLMANNLEKAKQDGRWDPAKLPLSDPNSWWQSFTTGLSYGSTPLNYGHVPSFQLDQKNMGFGSKLAASAGGLIGDANEMVAGGLTTTLLTANPVAGWAAGAALPAAIRSSAMYDLQHGHPTSWGDVATKGLQVTEDASKAGAEGALLYGVGKLAGPVAESAGGAVKNALAPSIAKVAAPVAKTAVEASAMGAAATVAASSLQGKLPSADDFLVATTMFAVIPAGRMMWGAVKPTDISSSVGATGRTVLTPAGENIQKNLQTLYAKTGINPVDAVRIASTDPWLKQSLASNNSDGEMNTKGWEQYAPPDPKTVPKETKTDETAPDVKKAETPAEPEPVKPLETVGMPSSNTGIPSIKSVSPDDLGTILKAADTELPKEVGAPEKPTADLAELADKYKNKDGSTDLESILIDHHAGEAAALLYRANGRDFSALPVPTQHYLESVGAILDKGGYAPEAPEEAATGGAGGKPPTTPPAGEQATGDKELAATGGSGGKPPIVPPPTDEGVPGRNWASAIRDAKQTIKPAVKGGAFDDIWRRVKGMWRELSPAAEQDKALGLKDDKVAGMEDHLRTLIYGASGRAVSRIREGGYTRGIDENGNLMYSINRDVPALQTVMSAAKKLPGGMDGFRAFGLAMNALDLQALGKKSTTDPVQAAADLKEMPSDIWEKYNDVWKDYQKVKNDLLQGAVFSGMKSQKQVDLLMAQRPNHFPQVAAEAEESARHGIGGNGGPIFAPAKGHEYKVIDPIFTDVSRMAKLEQVYAVNTARTFVVGALDRAGLITMSDAADQTDPLRIEGTKDDKAIADIGGDPKFFERDDQRIHFYEDGVHKIGTVKNFPGRDMFMRMMNGSTTALDNNWTTNFLSTFAKVQRSAIAESFNFFGRIAFQDSFQAAQFSKYGGAPMLNTLRGGFALIDKSVNEGKAGLPGSAHETVTEYMLNGGYGVALASLDRHGILGEWDRMDREGTFEAIPNWVKNPLDAMLTVTTNMDAATRIALYGNARNAGLGPMKAAVEARSTHGDNAERSLDPTINWLARISPFLRATQRGKVDGFMRSVAQDPVGFAARAVKMGVYFSMTSVALHYGLEKMFEATGVHVPEDMKMENQSAFDKFVSYQIPFVDTHGNYAIAKLPTAFDVGTFIHGTTVAFMSHWLDKDPITAKEYLGAMWKKMSAVPLPGYDNIAIKTPMDMYSNFNTGTGKTIIPASMEKRSANGQAFPWTSKTAQGISNLLGPKISNMANVSPIYIDKFMDDMGGDTGKSLLRVVDGVVSKNALPSDWANTPFIGGYFLRHPQMSARPIQQAEALYDAYDKTKNDFKAMEKAGDRAGATALIPTLNAGRGLDQMHKAISNARGIINGIESNEKLSAQDKRQNIDKLVDNMIISVRDQLARRENHSDN